MITSNFIAWLLYLALTLAGTQTPVATGSDHEWMTSRAPLYMVGADGSFYIEELTPKGFRRVDLASLPGPPKIRPGDRIHLQSYVFPFTWSYVLIEHSLYSWTLLWSWGPVPLDRFGIPRRPDPYPWVAGPEMPGANRLIFVSSLVPLPALESLQVSRICQRPQDAPANWPYKGHIAGNGDDALCNFTMLLNDRLPRERRGQDLSSMYHGEFVWRMWEDGREFPAYNNTGTGWGIAATTLKIQGVR